MSTFIARIRPSEGFLGGSNGKESACNAGDLGLIPALGSSSGGGHGYPLQYSCPENPMDKGHWPESPWGCKESDMTEQLSTWLFETKLVFSFPEK